MWICEKCGEPHQDQFKECWKCVGAEIETEVHVTAAPPPAPVPAPERRLRSAGSILLRAAVGFLIGAVLSLSSLNFINPQTILPGHDLSPAGRTIFALTAGTVIGAIVGLFFWVLFPYESTGKQTERQEGADPVESMD